MHMYIPTHTYTHTHTHTHTPQVSSAHLQIPGLTDPDPRDSPPTGGTSARGRWESVLHLAAGILPTEGLWVESPPAEDQCGFGFVLYFVSLTVCIVSIWEDLLTDFVRRVLRLRGLGIRLSCWAPVKVVSPSDIAGSPLEAVGTTPEPHHRCPGKGAMPWGPAQRPPESSARFVLSTSRPKWTSLSLAA